MAVLVDNDRAELWAEFMRRASQYGITFDGVQKADLRAAFNALDAYLDSKTVEINTAIPQPARGALSTDAKMIMFQLVVDLRVKKKVT